MHNDNIKAMASGKLGISGIAQAGVQNIHNAVAQGGIGALGSFIMQQDQLQDNIGRILGPVGMKNLQMRSILGVQNDLGYDKTPGGLGLAAMSMGMDKNQALQFIREANSPSFFKGLQKQLDVQIREMRATAADAHDREYNGIAKRMGRRYSTAESFGDTIDHIGRSFRNGLERMGQGVSEFGEDFMLREGEYAMRRPQELMAGGDLQMRGLQDRWSRRSRTSEQIGMVGGRAAGLLNLGGREYGRGGFADWWNDRVGEREEDREWARGEGGLTSMFAFMRKPMLAFGMIDRVPNQRDQLQGRADVSGFFRETRNQTGAQTEAAYAASKKAFGGDTDRVLAKLKMAAGKAANQYTDLKGTNARAGSEYFDWVQQELVNDGTLSAAQLAELKTNARAHLRSSGADAIGGMTINGQEAITGTGGDSIGNATNRDSTQRHLDMFDRANRAMFGSGLANVQTGETLKYLASMDDNKAAYFTSRAATERTGGKWKEDSNLALSMKLDGPTRSRLAKEYEKEKAEASGTDRFNQIGITGARLTKLATVNGVVDIDRYQALAKQGYDAVANATEGQSIGTGLQKLLPMQMQMIASEYEAPTKLSADERMERLLKASHGKGNVTKLWQDLANEFNRDSGDPTKKAAIIKRAQNIASNADGGGSSVQGSTATDRASMMIVDEKGKLADTQQQLAGSFPDAVSELRKSAMLLQEAASQLGGGMNRFYGPD
jgi:hypothetical protein